jgi:hypothetical protein
LTILLHLFQFSLLLALAPPRSKTRSYAETKGLGFLCDQYCRSYCRSNQSNTALERFFDDEPGVHDEALTKGDDIKAPSLLRGNCAAAS